MNSPIKEYIYILELNGGNNVSCFAENMPNSLHVYYVGKTKDIAKRFNDHKSQKGSAWTKQHGYHNNCKIIEIYECTSLFDEDKYTLEYMNKVGVDNVRGGSYSNCILTTEQFNNITRALRNANNLCMTCGESDHFADMCSTHKNDTLKFEVVNNNVPYVNNNELKFPHVRYLSPTGIVHNNIENGMENDILCDTNNATHNVGITSGDFLSSCGRCGRSNHTTTKCYAKTDIHGKML
jgi:hypothetical protein